LEAKESIQGEKEARNKIEEVRKKIEGNRMLLMVDVRFARHKLEEASKDMKTHGLQPHENFTKNKTKASEKGRAERKIKMIRNALNLIRAVS
jgi:glycerol dehydrogenase-like iron-containing ADH family enzyme